MAQRTATPAARDDSAAISEDCRHQLLLVEDDPGIADFLNRGLSAKGYGVTDTADGSRGYLLAKNSAFSLVILDWMIPGKPGRQVLDALHDSCPELPIIVMSASEEARRHVAWMASGTIRFIGKPFAMSELLMSIADLLADVPSCDDAGVEDRRTLRWAAGGGQR